MKVTISNVNPDPTVREQIEGSGLELAKSEDGRLAVKLGFPKVAALPFSLADCILMVGTLRRETPEGASPGAVFAQTARLEDTDGGPVLVGQFSREKRARKVSIPVDQLGDVAGLFEAVISKWIDWCKLAEVDTDPAQAEIDAWNGDEVSEDDGEDTGTGE